MRSAVDEPSHVEREAVTEHCSNKPGIDKIFTPEIHRNHRGYNKATYWHQFQVVSEVII